MSLSEASISIQEIEPDQIAIKIDDVDEEDKNEDEQEQMNLEECINNSKPSTSLETKSENQSNSGREQAHLSDLLNTESILKSLEDLSKQLIKEQEDLFKEFITSQPQAVSKHEIGVGSDHGDINLPSGIPDDPNYPPPPYSFHGISDQRVYLQHEIQYQDPAPGYYENFDNAFHSRKLRNKFVTKVYGILTSQLLITFGFVVICVYIVPVKNFVKAKTALYMISVIVLFAALILLACFINLRRNYPTNFILLLLLTVTFAYSIGAAACFYSEKAVMVAIGSTAIVIATITVLAWLNFFDVTSWGFVFFMAFLIILLFGVVASIIFWIIGGTETLKMVMASLLALMFTVYLLYDTQKLIGGGRIALNPEEYILGALSLYVDIVLIFNYILLLCIRR